jgi:hypothetical protein
MTTLQKIIFYFLMTAFGVVSIIVPEKLIWKIVLPVGTAFVSYLIYELDHAIEMPDDYDNYQESEHSIERIKQIHEAE